MKNEYLSTMWMLQSSPNRYTSNTVDISGHSHAAGRGRAKHQLGGTLNIGITESRKPQSCLKCGEDRKKLICLYNISSHCDFLLVLLEKILVVTFHFYFQEKPKSSFLHEIQ